MNGASGSGFCLDFSNVEELLHQPRMAPVSDSTTDLSRFSKPDPDVVIDFDRIAFNTSHAGKSCALAEIPLAQAY